MASPSRRSSRKKARVSYDENVVKIHQEEQVEKPRRRRAPPKKRISSRAMLDEESTDSEEEEPVIRHAPKKRKKVANAKGRGPPSERTCPHCDQVCSSKAGLKYHVDHYVCRPELNPEKPAAKGRGKKRATSDSDDEYEETAPAKPKGRKRGKGKKTKYKRERGPLSDRTCPHCKRVFTSVLGQEYHVKNKVCTSKKPSKVNKNIPFATLEAGSKFMTPFGIVEVVADNRAIPMAQPSAQAPKRNAHLRHQRGSMALAIKTRVQRGRLAHMYENDQLSQKGVFKVYFGGDPRKVAAKGNKPSAIGSYQMLQLDPPGPEGSYPDRMVECVLVPDERSKFVEEADDSDTSDDESMEVEAATSKSGEQVDDASNKSPYGMKLFLRRRTLTEPYIASSTVYTCEDCGGPFYSKVGYNYHIRSEVCITKTKKTAAATQKFLDSVEEKATSMLKRRIRPERKKSRRNVPVYPQVWLSLGFKFLAEKPPTKPEVIAQKAEEEAAEAEPLDDVLRRLKNELRRDRDRSLGTIYPGVFDSLQFRRPPPAWIIEAKEAKEKQLKAALAKKKRREELERQKKAAPPPIVDIQVLADEADSGRYPSVKRHSGEHEAFCAICKEQDGEKFGCDFCPKSVHLDCIRMKHTIKDPEPQDDFMCHHCIQYIQARRARAEKRRIQKQKTALKKSGQAPSAELALGTGGESEYHNVAALGHELRDITELIQDAKGRLRQAIGVSKVNEARRSMLA